MPCYSTVTETQITDATRLQEALKALGVDIGTYSTSTRMQTSIGIFFREKVGDAFNFSGTKEQLTPVGIKYGEYTLSSWALRNGMSIVRKEGQKITLRTRG